MNNKNAKMATDLINIAANVNANLKNATMDTGGIPIHAVVIAKFGTAHLITSSIA